MRTSVGIVFVLLVAGFGVVSGCGGDTSSGGSSAEEDCERFASKLQTCGLLSGGDTGCADVDPESGSECLTRCMQAATCGDIEQLLCEGRLPSGLSSCAKPCIDQAPGFVCGDGDSIPADWECDGEEDCLDGSDEVGCPAQAVFQCGDGETVPADWECDGDADCGDSSDEQGCPARAEITCQSSGESAVGSSEL